MILLVRAVLLILLQIADLESSATDILIANETTRLRITECRALRTSADVGIGGCVCSVRANAGPKQVEVAVEFGAGAIQNHC